MLSIGSNLGERLAHLQAVVDALKISNICCRESSDADVKPFTHDKAYEKRVCQHDDNGPVMAMRRELFKCYSKL